MLRLTLLRHAKAEPLQSGGQDFDRPLTSRGIEQAAEAAAQLAHLRHPPTLLLSSTARRTRQTAEAVRKALQLPAQRLVLDDRLYLARVRTLREVLRELGSGEHVLLVGHNPGLSELARQLDESRQEDLATGEFCKNKLAIDGWEEFG